VLLEPVDLFIRRSSRFKSIETFMPTITLRPQPGETPLLSGSPLTNIASAPRTPHVSILDA
jgi:hypothetical protein